MDTGGFHQCPTFYAYSIFSPWIYSEIELSRVIRRKPLSDYRTPSILLKRKALFAESELETKYDLILDQLCASVAVKLDSLLDYLTSHYVYDSL